jgi:hypothetical protein
VTSGLRLLEAAFVVESSMFIYEWNRRGISVDVDKGEV